MKDHGKKLLRACHRSKIWLLPKLDSVRLYAMLRHMNSNMNNKTFSISAETAIKGIPQQLWALAREARKYNSAEEFAGTLGIPEKDILWMKAFGSSVEGKPEPGDIDIFVAVKEGTMRFTKENELYNPAVKEVGMLHYFIMPESQAMELLDAMLYTGRKDADIGHTGKTVNIESLRDFYTQATRKCR